LHASAISCSEAFTKSPPIGCHSVIRGTIPRMGIGVALNQYAELDRTYTIDDVTQFASLVGDSNPIHILDQVPNHPLLHEVTDNESGVDRCKDGDTYQETTLPNRTGVVVHGMLVGSLFTAIIGTLIPGAVYLRQEFDFRQPVWTNTKVTGRIVVSKLRHFPRKNGLIMICQTTVYASPGAKTESIITGNSTASDSDFKQNIMIRGQASVWLPNGVRKDDG
jgi:acyl dehydratase